MRFDLRNGLVIALHAVLVSVGTIRHEMWRDEHQAWLVARDAASLDQVVRNLAYDGHPALWHSLLFVLTRFTHDPIAMQILHALLAVSVGAMLVLFAPFPRKIRYLLPFGYLFLFEYGVVSRSYALSALLVFAYCAWRVRGSARVGGAISWILLALLANTNAFGMLTAISLAVGRGMEAARAVIPDRRRGPSATTRLERGEVVGAVVFLGAVAFSVSCILPNQGSTFPVQQPSGLFDGTRFQSVLAHIGGSFAYLPEVQTHFWNTYMVPPVVRIILGIAVLVGATFALKKHGAALASFLTGSLLLAAAQYWTGLGWIRYTGFHVILLIAGAWLASADRCANPNPFSAQRGEAGRYAPPARTAAGRLSPGKSQSFLSSQTLVTVTLVLAAIHAASGLFAWSRDMRLPFSTSARAAEFLRSASADGPVPGTGATRPIIGATDFIVSPLSSHLDRKIFYIERAEFGSFVIWDARRKPEYTFEDLRNAVRAAMDEGPSDEGFLVVSLQPRYRQEGVIRPLEATMLGTDLRIDLVQSVPPGIVEEEQYFIYAVRRVPQEK